MAVTADRVIVELEAKVDRYFAEIRKAQQEFDRRLDQMEKRSRRASKNVGDSFNGLAAKIFTAYTARQVQKFIDSAIRIENSLKIAGLQGQELGRVYQQLLSSAQANAAPLETLAELYNRAALAQKDLGASSGDLIRFVDKVAVALRVSGKSAEETRGALIQLSQAVGSNIVRAEEFNSILEGALPIAQAAAAGLKEAGGNVARLRTLVINGKVSSEAFFKAFLAGSRILDEKVASAQFTVEQNFTRLQNSAINAAGAFDKVYGVSTDVGEALNDVAGFVDDVAAAFRDSESDLNKWIRRLNKAGDAIAEYRRKALQFLTLGLLGNSTPEPQVNKVPAGAQIAPPPPGFKQDGQGGLVSINDFPASGTKNKGNKPYDTAIKNTQKQTAILQAQTKAQDRSTYAQEKAAKTAELLAAAEQQKLPITAKLKAQIDGLADSYARAKSVDEFQAALASTDETIRGLLDEANALGKTQVEADALRFKQDLLNEARQAGVELTPDVIQSIDQTTEAYKRAATRAEGIRKDMQRQISVADEVRQGFIDIGTAGAHGFDSLGDAVSSFLSQLGDLILQLYVLKPLMESLFGQQGTVGGGAIGGAISGLTSALGFADGGVMTPNGPRQLQRYASGGVSNRAAIFGEAGPEAAVPLPDGRRIPVDLRIPDVGASRPSVTQQSTYYIDARGAQAGVADEIEKKLRQLDGSIERRAVSAVMNTKAQGGARATRL